MKKIILLFLISVVPGLVSADVISQVSYNPSRIGQFSTLKAADRIVFLGGLITPTLTVKKNTTFEWENNGTYVIQSIASGDPASNGTLKLTDGVLQGWQSNIQTYNGAGIPTLPDNPITLQVAGGNVSFGNSYVNNLVNGLNWRVYAGSVNVAALEISGTSGTGGSPNLVNAGHSAGSESDGFRLAGGNIPYKNFGSDNLEWCEKPACRGNACSPMQTVSLLGYNCSGSGGGEGDPEVRYEWIKYQEVSYDIHALTPNERCASPYGVSCAPCYREGYGVSSLPKTLLNAGAICDQNGVNSYCCVIPTSTNKCWAYRCEETLITPL